MKFDEKYPEAQNDFEAPSLDPMHPGPTKWLCECPEVHTCAVCGEPCTWVNFALKEFVCSEECEQKLWSYKLRAYVLTAFTDL